MKKNFLLPIVALLISVSVFSQSTIEFLGAAGVGGPAGVGPVTTAQVATFHTVAATAYSPAITATYTITNQQFAGIEGNATSPGTQMGGGITGTANTPVPGSNIYDLMNALSGSVNANYTACNSCVAGTGIDVTANRSIQFNSYADALIDAAGTQLFALNTKVQYADITITFNRPVSNPMLHLTGMGGQVSYTTNIGMPVVSTNYDMGFATELDLLTPGLTWSKISGNAALTVSSTQITNNAVRLGAATTPTALHGVIRSAASGTVVVLGTNITTISFRLFLRGDGGIVVDNAGTVVAANNGNIVRWALHGGFIPGGGGTTVLQSISGDGFLFGLSLQQPVTISGTVFNDPDAGNVNNSSAAAPTNLIPTGLNANLIDANGRVVATVAVATNGTYSFPAIFEGNYSVNISSTAGTQGATAPASAAPTGWSLTGEFNGTPNTGTDGTVNGTSAVFTVAAANVTNINFGIDRLPESAINLQAIGGNPGGFNSKVVPAGAFQTNNVGATPNTSDFDGGTVTSMRITAFPSNANSITINGTVYTNGGTCPPATSCTAWPGAGVTVPYTNGTGPTQAISVDPVEGNVDVIIPFAAIDNAGKEDATPGSVTVPFRTITLSGTVWNDANGNLIQNGAEAVVNGTNTGGGVVTGAVLYANLIDAGGNVIATAPVASDGTYSFPNVPQSSTGLVVQLSQNQGTIGLAKPATALPTGWVTTGENKNGQGGPADATANGEIPVTTITTNITAQNFGIERTPTSPNQSYTIAQPAINTLQTLNGTGAPNSPGPLNGTDPEDGTLGTGNTFNIVSVAGLNGNKLFYNGVEITGPVSIPSYNPALLQVQYTALASTSLSFTFNSADAAGKLSNTASYTINWLAPLPLQRLEVSVDLKGTTVVVNWLTENELNVTKFIVERSTDNRIFTAVAEKPGAGNNSALNNFYNSSDDITALMSSTVIYYRIKVIDNDGKIGISKTVVVRIGAIDGIKIWPNPFIENIVVVINSDITQQVKVHLFDSKGSIVASAVYSLVKGNNQVNFKELIKLPKGSYLLTITDKKGKSIISKIMTK